MKTHTYTANRYIKPVIDPRLTKEKETAESKQKTSLYIQCKKLIDSVIDLIV